MRILTNPALLRALVVLFCAGFAFLLGVLFIRLFRQQIADETEVGEQKPRTLDALPLHVYNTVIQQLKEQKHELVIASQAEQQRAKTNETLNQGVLSDLPCGVLIFGPNGLVKSVNPAAKTILGFASMMGMGAEDVFRGTVVRKEHGTAAVEDPVAFADEVRAVLHEGSQRRDLEGRYETPAGDERFLGMTVSPLGVGGDRLLGVSCLISDLSALENTRRERDSQLEMTAEMALKVRTSLRSICEYAQQLASSRDSQLALQLANDIAEEAAELEHSLGSFLTSGRRAAATSSTVS